MKTAVALAFSILLAAVICAQESAKPVVGLDCYHNNEKQKNHYWWQGTDPGGFSQLGDLIKGLGAELGKLTTSATAESLGGFAILIIVDPDTPQEASEPKYIEESEIEAIVSWVKSGGILLLMGNNKGNTEFAHLNKLAKNFGITFNEDTAATGKPDFEFVSGSAIAEGVKKIHIVGMCTLTIAPPAEEVLTKDNQVLMASSKLGQGTVYAVGDPWVYNEYINHQDNRKMMSNLFKLLLSKAKPPATKK